MNIDICEVIEAAETREHSEYAGRKSQKVEPGYDLYVLATLHDEYRKTDYSGLKAPVVDTRHIVPSIANAFAA